MKTYVLDSWALCAWLNKEEPAASRVHDLLEKASEGRMKIFMSILNLGEVFYGLAKTRGIKFARMSRSRFTSLPLEIVPVDDDLVWEAAEIKAHHAISYADAFCAALANRKSAPVVTGDPDFKDLKDAGKVRIRWLRREGRA